MSIYIEKRLQFMVMIFVYTKVISWFDFEVGYTFSLSFIDFHLVVYALFSGISFESFSETVELVNRTLTNFKQWSIQLI